MIRPLSSVIGRLRPRGWRGWAPAAAFLAGCGVLAGLLQGTSRPTFNHFEHAEKGAECKDCHGEKLEAEAPVIPKMSVCLDCHEDLDKDQADPARKASVFLAEGQTEPVWSGVTALAKEVIFDHAAHVKAGTKCAECHGAVETTKAVTADFAVPMEACVRCHAEKAPQYTDCASCHEERRKDRQPPSHLKLWASQHGAVARGAAGAVEAGRCALCHTEGGCQACHLEQTPRDHTPVWRHQAHGIASALDRDRCATCHTTDTCQRCHQEAAPRSHRGTWGGTAAGHCYTCHNTSPTEGCAVCHQGGAPSHLALAAGKPAWHTPGMNCRQCHTPASVAGLPHADNGMDCNACHR